MTKSLTDHVRDGANGRLRAYVEQDRREGVHPAIIALHRRPHSRDDEDGRKVTEYARIARGHEV